MIISMNIKPCLSSESSTNVRSIPGDKVAKTKRKKIIINNFIISPAIDYLLELLKWVTLRRRIPI